MLGRGADSTYWLCRYVERAENVARFIDVELRMLLDLPVGALEQWEPLVAVTGDRDLFFERYGEATRENVIRFLTFDPEYPNSILSCLSAARENARMVREVISSEMWEAVNRFYLMVTEASADRQVLDTPHGFLTEVKNASHLFVGINLTTLSHGEAWQFCRLGRMLERADKTTRILDVKYYRLLPSVTDVGTPYDIIQWAALLRSASALEMYRKQYGRITPAHVIAFLLLDREFPRAVQYCLTGVQDSLHSISGVPVGRYSSEAERLCGQVCAELAYASGDEIALQGLHTFLDEVQRQVNGIGQAIFERFFALPPTPDAQSQSLEERES